MTGLACAWVKCLVTIWASHLNPCEFIYRAGAKINNIKNIGSAKREESCVFFVHVFFGWYLKMWVIFNLKNQIKLVQFTLEKKKFKKICPKSNQKNIGIHFTSMQQALGIKFWLDLVASWGWQFIGMYDRWRHRYSQRGRGTVLGHFAYSRSTWSDLSKCQNFRKLLLLLPELYIYKFFIIYLFLFLFYFFKNSSRRSSSTLSMHQHKFLEQTSTTV